MIDLSGKVAVITGSSRGIGKAIAEACARAGASVVVSSRKAEACEAVAAGLRAAGHKAFAHPCHVGRKEDLESLLAAARAHFGPIDILVCNAAVNPVYGTMAELSDEAFDKIMTANVKGTLWLCNMVIPQMVERGGGSVILLSR